MPATAMPDTASLDAATTHTCDSLKAELRRWELAFAAEHGRKPQKADIDREPDIGKWRVATVYRCVNNATRRHLLSPHYSPTLQGVP